MSASLFLWLFLAVVIFWAVGVYNRLMRLRARARDVLSVVDRHLSQQVELICQRLGVRINADAVQAIQSDWDLESGWLDLTMAVSLLDAALRKVRAHPLEPDSMHALGMAADALQQQWITLRDAPADLAGATVPDDMREEWDALAAKCKSARGGLNQILANYELAISQFPARLLAGFLGYVPAGRV